MNSELPGYRKIDLETWPRREHYRYYREFLKCGYSLTTRLDVTAAVAFAHARGKRFYGCFLYAAARAVNSVDEMKLMTAADGAPGVWEEVHLNFTVFHQDDQTFSDLWTEYDPDFETFYQKWEQVLETYGGCHGVKGRPGQPANFFCISCVPWMDYTGFNSYAAGEPALFPIITFGKYTRDDAGRCTLPVTVTISHAAADGYHVSRLFQILQERLDDFGRVDGVNY